MDRIFLWGVIICGGLVTACVVAYVAFNIAPGHAPNDSVQVDNSEPDTSKPIRESKQSEPPDPYAWMAFVHNPAQLNQLIDKYPEIIEPKEHNPDSWIWQGTKLGRTTCVELLVMRGAIPTVTDLEVAVMNGRTELFELFWSLGLRSDNLAYFAAQDEQPTLLVMLIGRNVDINARSELGYFPLHAAVINKRYGNAKILLEYGAQVNTTDLAGYTPLDWALHDGQVDLAELLKSYGGRRGERE